MRCPICEKNFDPKLSTALPFCSNRCRQIDLGRWLRQDYQIAGKPLEDDESQEPEGYGELLDDGDDT